MRPSRLPIVLLCLALAGCRATSSSPYATQPESARNPLRAQQLTLEAAEILRRDSPDLRAAEKLLRSALEADLYHGPAHNNLGVVYLKQSLLFEAASEFEWAKKMLPGHPDPRTNLALTLERAGRTDEALRTYASALEVYPDHLPTIQALTRLELRAGKPTDHTRAHLEAIAMQGKSPEWRAWAQSNLSRFAPPH
jgi:tetratricopeptide (TPR) repeat protein